MALSRNASLLKGAKRRKLFRKFYAKQKRKKQNSIA